MLWLSFDSIYIKPIDLYEMELGLTVFFRLYMLYFSSLSPLFLLFLECWVSCLGWPSWLGASRKAQVGSIDSAMEEVKDWSSIETVCYSLILSGLL